MPHRATDHRRLRLVGLLIVGLGGVGSADAQTYSYPDKLSGDARTLRAVPGEVMVRFEAVAGKAPLAESIEPLLQAYGLEVIPEAEASQAALDRHRLGVYRVAAGPVDALAEAPGVRAVLPGMRNERGEPVHFLPDEFTIQFRPGTSPEAAAAAVQSLGLTISRDFYTPGYYAVRLPRGGDLFAKLREASALDAVAFAEPAFVALDAFRFVPNDPALGQQWHLRNTGVNATGATAGADVGAQTAWDFERGDPRILVAIVDSGTDWSHPDLVNNVHQNLGEDADGDGRTIEPDGAGGWRLDPGDHNEIDDDGSGLVDDLIGWDFEAGDADPASTNAHGTWVAGIVAAQGDNGIGVAGLAHGARIMPVKIGTNTPLVADANDALAYVADFVQTSGQYRGAVINGSWSGPGFDSQGTRAALRAALDAGVLPVFAAGNSDEATVAAPARFEGVMAVAATSPCDTRKRSGADPGGVSCDLHQNWGSNYGDALSLSAPGVEIVTTDLTDASGVPSVPGDYASVGGTSFAAPLVAASAALVLSAHLDAHPGGPMPSPGEVQRVLEATADRVGPAVYNYAYDPARPGFSRELGAGRLNAWQAVRHVLLGQDLDGLQARPIDLAFALDRSGSMAAPAGKFEAAKNAAQQVVRQMNVGDRVAVTSFSGPTHPDGTASTDLPIRSIAGPADRDDAVAAIDGLLAAGATALGEGLLRAQGALAAAPPPPNPRHVLLLTDGMSDTPAYLLPTLDGGALAGTAVHALGYGDARGAVSEDSLDFLAAVTGGRYTFAEVAASVPGSPPTAGRPGVPLSPDLTAIKAYQTAFQGLMQRQGLRLVERDARRGLREVVGIDSYVAEAQFSILWEDPDARYAFLLIAPSGRVIGPQDADGKSVVYIEDETLAEYRVRLPEPGPWELVVDPGGEGGAVHVQAWAYSRCRLVVDVLPRGLGDDLPIEARLLVLSEKAPSEPVPLARGAVFALVHPPNRTPPAAPLYVELNDAGVLGDAAAGDGIYGGIAPAGGYDAGSWIVEVSAEGKGPDGFPVSRYTATSAYVGEADSVTVAATSQPTPPGEENYLGIHVRDQVETFDSGAAASKAHQQPTGFVAEMTYDPAIIRLTGEVLTASTLFAQGVCTLDDTGEGAFSLACTSEEPITGVGTLARVGYRVLPTAPYGAVSTFGFAGFRFVGAEVAVRTEAGAVVAADPLAYGSADACLLGDPTKDTRVTAADATLDLRFIVELDAAIPACANVDGSAPGEEDGGITTADAALKLQYAAGQIACFPATRGCPPIEQRGSAVFGRPLLEEAETLATYTLTLPLLEGETLGFTYTLTFDPRLVRVVDVEPSLPDGWLAVHNVLEGRLKVAAAGTTPPPPGDLVTVSLRMAAGGAETLGSIVEPANQEPQPVAAEDAEVPARFALEQNHPNPFNPRTSIAFALPQRGPVRLAVYDLLGREVQRLVDAPMQAGTHRVTFEARDLPSGVYLYRLQAQGQERTRQMVLLK